MRSWSCTATSEAPRRRLLAALVAGAVLLSGCTNLFFLPMRKQVLTPAQLSLASEDVWLASADGTRLFAWHLAAAAPAGVVCYFHGNAQNISTHILNVAWLPSAGYEVLLLDYRGYGASAGDPTLPGALDDVRAGLDWCLARGEAAGVPVFALGQSLGAALLLEAATAPPYRDRLAAVVADSSFAGYRRIARDALAGSWLLAPLKYPLSLLVTGDHAPVAAVARKGALPLLVMHSREDEVIPYRHGRDIVAAAPAPACFLETTGPHNAAFRDESVRQRVAAFLATAAAGTPACP